MDAVEQFDSFWVYSPELAEYSVATQLELGLVGNGPDSTLGNVDGELQHERNEPACDVAGDDLARDAEVAAQRVDHRRHVSVGVGVDPKGYLEHVDMDVGICDDGHRCPLVVVERVGSTRQQPVDKTVMGA